MGGTVSVFAPTETTNGVVTYAVQIQLDAAQVQAAGVRSGMTASATIVTDSHANVVEVPNRAIKTQGPTKTATVLDANGQTESRQVQVGVSNDQVTEILSGLQAGDKVVITGMTTAIGGSVHGRNDSARPPGRGLRDPPRGSCGHHGSQRVRQVHIDECLGLPGTTDQRHLLVGRRGDEPAL